MFRSFLINNGLAATHDGIWQLWWLLDGCVLGLCLNVGSQVEIVVVDHGHRRLQLIRVLRIVQLDNVLFYARVSIAQILAVVVADLGGEVAVVRSVVSVVRLLERRLKVV